jgi:hypothetical protein
MLTETLSVFFPDFGQSAVVGGEQVSVIFDNAYEGASVGAMVMAGTQPAITLATADVPANPVGATVTTGGSAYTIAEHRPDGTGMSVCLLETAA